LVMAVPGTRGIIEAMVITSAFTNGNAFLRKMAPIVTTAEAKRVVMKGLLSIRRAPSKTRINRIPLNSENTASINDPLSKSTKPKIRNPVLR